MAIALEQPGIRKADINPSSPWDVIENSTADRPVEPIESTPDTSTSSIQVQESRLGKFLRGAADRIDARTQSAAEKKEIIKSKLRNAGRAGLRVLEKTGRGIVFAAEVGVGTALYAGQATAEAAIAVKDASINAGRNIKQGAESARDTAVGAAMLAQEKVADTISDKTDQIKSFGSEKIKGIREWLNEKAENARNRRQARREKWANRINSAKDFVQDKYNDSKDFARDKYEQSVANVHVLRAAGRAGIDAARQTAATHREQNKL